MNPREGRVIIERKRDDKKKARANRDHAKKKQRPDISDEVIAKQLEALLTPAIDAPSQLLPKTGIASTHYDLAIDGGSSIDIIVARCAKCA